MPNTTAAEPVCCQFCGRVLEPRTIVLGGVEVFAGVAECDCEGARADRDAQREREALRAAGERERRRLARLERSGIRRRFLRAEHPLSDRVVDVVGEGRGAYIWGPVGVGKTHLAAAAAIGADRAGMRFRMATTSEILDSIKRSFNSTNDPLQPWLTAPLAVIDDLGKEAPTDWVLDRLFVLADERSSGMLPTVVTTQYSPSALIKRLARKGDFDTAQAIVSRLVQDAEIIKLDGADRRLKGDANEQMGK